MRSGCASENGVGYDEPGFWSFAVEFLDHFCQSFFRIAEFDHATEVDLAREEKCVDEFSSGEEGAFVGDESCNRTGHGREGIVAEDGRDSGCSWLRRGDEVSACKWVGTEMCCALICSSAGWKLPRFPARLQHKWLLRRAHSRLPCTRGLGGTDRLR